MGSGICKIRGARPKKKKPDLSCLGMFRDKDLYWMGKKMNIPARPPPTTITLLYLDIWGINNRSFKRGEKGQSFDEKKGIQMRQNGIKVDVIID